MRSMHTDTPTLLALHCSAGSPAQWNPYRAHTGGSVLWHTPPLMGYGEAGWRRGMPLSLEDEASRLLPFLKRSPEPVDIVGHSYGGAVALMLAACRPELVRSVTVYEPVLFGLLAQDASSAAHAKEVAAVADDVRLFAMRGDELLAAESFVDYWSGWSAWWRLGRERQDRIAAHMPKVAAEFRALFDARIDFSKADVMPPVRIVVGTSSPAPVRRIAEILHWQLPRASIVHLAGGDHMTPVTQPRKVMDLMLPQVRQELALAA